MNNWLPHCSKFPRGRTTGSPFAIPGIARLALLILFLAITAQSAISQVPCSRICGMKFNDENCNGVLDPGEQPIPGWKIHLSDGQSVLTDANGKYCFTVCVLGTYVVSESQVQCWRQTLPPSPGTYTVNVPAGGLVLSGYDFGNSNTGTLCIFKFDDRNCDGIQQRDEPGLPDWKFEIFGEDGDVISVVTGDDGSVCVRLKCGVYRVCEQLQDGWVPTIAECQEADISPCRTSRLIFGNSMTGELCILKFNDRNCDGIRQHGEEGIEGWKFVIRETGESVVTGPGGIVCIRLKAGKYTVCEEMQDGWVPTTPECQTVEVFPCRSTFVSFGNSNSGLLCVFKFNDINCNGVQDRGEGPLKGWIFVIRETGDVLETDESGFACITLKAGTYTVCERLQDGWVPTIAECQTAEVHPCRRTVVIFGNSNSGILCVFKFNDINCNGVQDRGEGPLKGWQFVIRETGDVIETDETGFACITLKAGVYTVCEIQQRDWVPTTPECQTAEVHPCRRTLVIFGNSNSGVLCVFKFNDANCNGVQDPGEGPLKGWKFVIRETGDVIETDASGFACITLTAGVYTVCEEPQPGWVPTTPDCQRAEVHPCRRTVVVFGNSNTGELCVFKFNDINCNGVQDPGEPGLSGWRFRVTPIGPLPVSFLIVTGTGGVGCIRLPAGVYQVCEQIQPGWTPTIATCQTVTVAPCQTSRLIFGNSSTGTLCISKFNDRNCNGIQDPGEPGIPGWKFQVTNGATTFSVLTGNNGTVCVTVTSSTYTVCEEVRTGWVPTTPTCQTVTVVTCGTTKISFGNSSSGTLCIFKFNDFNCNGSLDPGEPFLPNWTFSVSQGGLAFLVNTGNTGFICIDQLTAGNYVVCEIVKSGWTPTTPVCQTATVLPCLATRVLFGNASTGTICVTKFNDVNCNGVRDPGEQVIPGWKFSVTRGLSSTTIITDNTGTACLRVTAATYTVCEEVRPGWTPTTPVCRDVNVATCATLNLVFGNSSTGSICVLKFNDINCNGIQDPGEPGLPGWRFTVNGAVLMITDANGKACVRVTSGTYVVCEVTQAGWRPTTPICRTITVAPCQSTDLVFGNSSTGTICVFKFNDANCNGVQDPGELGLSGWRFTVNGVVMMITDANGKACVQVPAGNYTVCEVLQAGWVATTPVCRNITVLPCQTVSLVYGNSKTGELCVYKFHDLNCNGIWEHGEPGLPGWQFVIQGTNIVLVTDESGRACTRISAGTYVVCEILQDGWVPTTPQCQTVTVQPCQTSILVFGNNDRGFLCILKFRDDNGDGQQDPDEPGIPGWKFDVNGTSYVTGSNGIVCVELPAGTYTVCEEMLENWTPTTRPCQEVTVVPCKKVLVSFGNKPDCKEGRICGFKFYDRNGNGLRDPGEPTLAGWKITVDGNSVTETDADGFYCITLPAGGTFEIGEVQQPGWEQTAPQPVPPGTYTVTVQPCISVRGYDFGNRRIDRDDEDGSLQKPIPGDPSPGEIPGNVLESMIDPSLKSAPNPASGQTTLMYTLTQAGEIKLELFNTLGQLVQVVEQGYRVRGQYSRPLDLSSVPAGTYRVRLSIGNTAFYTMQLVVQ